MSHRSQDRALAVLSAAVALALIALASPALAQGPMLASNVAGIRSEVPKAEIDAIRAATAKYMDVAVAEADGYVRHPMCIVAAMEGQPSQLGGMGYHYFRPDLLGITAEEPRVDGNGTHADWLQPAILLYEPQSDGSLRLVAIENLIWVKAWKEAGNESPPEFHGNEYYHMIDNPETEIDEAHGFEPHYELHWWMYRDNASGAFSPFNPAVNCDHDADGMQAAQ